MRNFGSSFVLGIFFAALVGGCASQRELSSTPSATSQATKLQLIYSTGRYGTVEPCGCSMRPLGGIVREWNAMKSLRSQPALARYSLGSGPSFIPDAILTPKEMSQHRTRAEIINESLAAMKMDIYSPAIAEFILGVDFIKKLSAQPSAPKWVSANIVDRKTRALLFPAFVELPVPGDRKILVVGLSGKPSRRNDNREVGLLSPEDGLRAALKKATGSYSLVVVISSMDKKTREGLQAKFPQVNVILGGDNSIYDNEILQENATLVRAEPDSLGKTLAVLNTELPAKGAPTQLFSEDMANRWAFTTRAWEDEREVLEDKIDLTKGLSKKEKARLTAKKAKLDDAIARSESVMVKKPGASEYTSKFVALDSAWESKEENPMQALVTRFLKVGSTSTASKP